MTNVFRQYVTPQLKEGGFPVYSWEVGFGSLKVLPYDVEVRLLCKPRSNVFRIECILHI